MHKRRGHPVRTKNRAFRSTTEALVGLACRGEQKHASKECTETRKHGAVGREARAVPHGLLWAGILKRGTGGSADLERVQPHPDGCLHVAHGAHQGVCTHIRLGEVVGCGVGVGGGVAVLS
jgi:hypothetical protein